MCYICRRSALYTVRMPPINPMAHSNDPRDNLGDYVLGKDGKPVVDRYGRPVRRRPADAAKSAEAAEATGSAGSASSDTPRKTADREFARVERTRSPQREEHREHTRYEASPQRQAERTPERPRQHMPRQEYQPRRVPERPAQQYATQYEQRGYDPYAPQYQPEVPTHVSGGRGRRPRRRKAKAPGCIALLTTLIVLMVAGTLFMDSRLTRVDALPATQIPNTAGTNWLLVGSDSRTGMSEKDAERLGTGGDIGSSRTDTIMLLHLPTTGSATLISIPRDSYVQVPGYGYDKVNAAFAYGGPKLLASTVEQATGLHIDRYAEIGMGGLANAVDAVGGVEICVKEAINDPLANLDVQPGCQKMDGVTGLGYVRTRATAQGDLDRVERQREFLAALMDKIASPAVLVNPIRMISLAWTTPTLFAVGQKDHIWNLARIPLAMRGGLETKTIPVGGFMDTEVGSVVVWDDAGAQQLFNSLR